MYMQRMCKRLGPVRVRRSRYPLLLLSINHAINQAIDRPGSRYPLLSLSINHAINQAIDRPACQTAYLKSRFHTSRSEFSRLYVSSTSLLQHCVKRIISWMFASCSVQQRSSPRQLSACHDICVNAPSVDAPSCSVHQRSASSTPNLLQPSPVDSTPLNSPKVCSTSTLLRCPSQDIDLCHSPSVLPRVQCAQGFADVNPISPAPASKLTAPQVDRSASVRQTSGPRPLSLPQPQWPV